MGVGRKTQTFTLKEKSDSHWTANGSVTSRNLRQCDLAGVIFGCKHNTINECYSKLLFGLPAPHFAYVKNINPGLPLFLFNYSDRKLHGIFEAASTGQMNINPYGWTVDGSEYTPYCAQVRVRIKIHCQPLLEDQFKPVIAQNYYEPKCFWFELDRVQTGRLISLFSSSPITASSSLNQINASWNTLFKALPTSDARCEGDNIEAPASEVDVVHTDQSIVEWGSYWDSYVLDGEYQPPEASINGEAQKNYEQSLIYQNQNCSSSYSSVVRHTSTAFPPKKWSALFKTSTSSDMKNQDEDLNRPASVVNSPYLGHYNMEWESSHTLPFLDGANQLLETSVDEEGAENNEELGIWEPNCNVSFSSVAVELKSPLPMSTSVKSFCTADTGKDGEDFNTVDSEVNLPHTDEFNLALGSSYAAYCSEGEGCISEAPAEDDSAETSKEELANLQSNCEYSNSSVVLKEINSDNHGEGSAPPSVTELQWENKSTQEAELVSEMMKSPDFQYIVAKLIQVAEELKGFQLGQEQKISSLEQELAESRREVQQLKDQRKMMDSSSFPSLVQCKGAECEFMIEPRASIQESILIVGGFDGFSWLSALDSYSPSQDYMRSLRPMNFVRSYASAAKLNGELFVFGGVDGDFWYDTVESYSPISNQWAICPSLNKKKGSLAGVSLNNKIFAIGGGNGVECFSEVEMLDLNIGSWTLARSMFHKRFAPAAAEINGILYVVGGYDGKDYLKSVERFDPREDSWTRIASMSSRRGCHSLTALNEKLYAVGGYDGTKMVRTVEILDPRIGVWRTVESMNDCRGYSGALTFGDSIYVIGGVKDDGEILDTIECYKVGYGWQVTDLKAVGKRCFFSAIVL